ncbi:hypothetical protein Pmani_012323 [Petrolisthes manimaculis]|uniref:Uncharacterized protein n=1 Tax=Petrolisthes manimaculis TaxID=1843537 RepID=A0AAE1UAE2_9EUCA|nr:hypothetical protein Pmani_012323 [Petrolisthes manimaculis]
MLLFSDASTEAFPDRESEVDRQQQDLLHDVSSLSNTSGRVPDASSSAFSGRLSKEEDGQQQDFLHDVSSLSNDATLTSEERGVMRLMRDVQMQAIRQPVFAVEMLNLQQTINHNLYQQVLQLKKQVADLVKEIAQLKKELEICEEQKQNSLLEATACLKESLGGKFTNAQVDFLISRKPIVRWEEEDISNAIAIRRLSTKSYHFLHNKMMIPLPSVTTLKRWVSKISVEPGILHSVLRLLKHQSERMTDKERLCTLSMDETSVCGEWT